MDKSLVAVLAVALLTWGGVFVYILRLENLARGLERQLESLQNQTPTAPETASREQLNI